MLECSNEMDFRGQKEAVVGRNQNRGANLLRVES